MSWILILAFLAASLVACNRAPKNELPWPPFKPKQEKIEPKIEKPIEQTWKQFFGLE